MFITPPKRASLELFVIFEKPLDFSDKFVVRQQFVVGGAVVMGGVRVASCLARARKCVPDGCSRISRTEQDDVKIIEVWL
jgi:hypothetical protein